jgi:hypothetical protein
VVLLGDASGCFLDMEELKKSCAKSATTDQK